MNALMTATCRMLLAPIGAPAVLAGLPSPLRAQLMDAARLKIEGPLGDRALGDSTAPVTVVEYASLTCPHCAGFHTTAFPALKQNYIDTGKVRFVLREFPLGPLATAALMVARRDGGAAYFETVDLLFRTQEDRTHADKPVEAMIQALKVAGISQDTFDVAIRDEAVYQHVMTAMEIGWDLGVNARPTFFINGRREVGARTMEQIDTILGPLIESRP